MKWQDVREKFPEEWVLIEALNSRSEDGFWIVDDVSVVDTFGDDSVAMWEGYTNWRRKAPQREIFFYHTTNENITVEELHPIFFSPMRQWHKSES